MKQIEGQDWDCTKKQDCNCQLCQSVILVLDLLCQLLAAIIENNSREHYNWIMVNLTGLAEACSEELEKRKEEQTVH